VFDIFWGLLKKKCLKMHKGFFKKTWFAWIKKVDCKEYVKVSNTQCSLQSFSWGPEGGEGIRLEIS